MLDVKVDNWSLYMDFIAFKLGFLHNYIGSEVLY
jgi:hypothetical protein